MSIFNLLLLWELLLIQIKLDEAETVTSLDLCSKMSPNLMFIDEANGSFHYKNSNNFIKISSNCAETTIANNYQDDVYLLSSQTNNLRPFCAFCIHDGDSQNVNGWTIIQRREDGSENFNRNWNDYKYGFGDAYSEYWIGLERLYIMTKDQTLELWISIEDYEGQIRHVKYSNFSIASENEDYKLTVSGYEGYIGDDFSDHNDMKFSTFDNNNIPHKSECSRRYKGGWWFSSCTRCSNLNGPYYSYSDRKTLFGINWISWLGENMSLKYTHMAIRPRSELEI